MNWKRSAMGRFLPVFFVIAFLLATGALAQEKTPSPTPFPVLGKRVEIRGWEEGRLSWLLRAVEIKLDKEGNRALCQGGVELEVYGEEGEIRSTLKASAAEIDLELKNFRFWDTVEVVSKDGDRLVTEELLYRDRLKRLETKSTTQVFFNGNVIECEGLSSDIDFEKPEFYRITKGSFRLGS